MALDCGGGDSGDCQLDGGSTSCTPAAAAPSPSAVARVATSACGVAGPWGPGAQPPPAAAGPTGLTSSSSSSSHGGRVVTEIVDTERKYVRDLRQIVHVS